MTQSKHTLKLHLSLTEKQKAEKIIVVDSSYQIVIKQILFELSYISWVIAALRKGKCSSSIKL